MVRFKRWSILYCFCLWTLSLAGPCMAEFPARPVRFVVGFAPGGSTDASARLIAKQLSDKWNQPVVVDNKPGGDSTLAAGVVARATPDGYTILWASNAHTITATQQKLDFDAVKSFSPITLMGYVPELLLVNPAVTPAGTAKELIALARSKPGRLNFGSSGMGASSFLEMALLMNMTGTDMVHVTYKGGGPAMTALLSGEIQLMFGTVTTGLGQVRAGKLRALAITGKVRSPLLPDVPTIAEAINLHGFEETSPWNGAMVPARTPAPVVAKLNADFVAAINAPNVQRGLTDLGYVTVAGTPAAFRATIAHDIERWGTLLKKINVK